ncbi:unnamed protein product [Peniophora sp. CBMAI 1063]|nr:unnamed protein product [Peniophora sp. CBMAI 1063]
MLLDDVSNEQYDDSYGVQFGPHIPEYYILLRPHPHAAGKTRPLTARELDDLKVIIPLDDSGSLPAPSPSPDAFALRSETVPWAPFPTEQDFEWFEVHCDMPASKMKKDLDGMHSGKWADRCKITFRTPKDVQFQADLVRATAIPYTPDTITETFQGTPYTVDFEYRDPWAYVRSVAKNQAITHLVHWHSTSKVLVDRINDTVDPLFDEPETGSAWAKIEDQLPHADPYPHCLFPLLFWLDKGLVSKHVKMHPMIIRPLSVHSSVRNGSGNGGAFVLGMMEDIPDPPGLKDWPKTDQKAWARFKRRLYQKVLGRIWDTCRKKAKNGGAVECSDLVTRSLHPAVHVLSLDAEEAGHCNCTRGPKANYPCPKCLVYKKHLADITSRTHPPRTKEGMQRILKRAREAGTLGEAEKLLKKHGIYDVDQFLFDFAFSDPYKAYAYDILHSDDEGKWGKHLFEFIKKVLEHHGVLGAYTDNMRSLPRWARLRHFNDVTKKDAVYDGNQFMDILRTTLPCIANLLPADDDLVHDTRAYQRVRMTLGLRLMSGKRKKALQDFIAEYERTSKIVAAKTDDDEIHKNFDFLKQHLTAHAPDDIEMFGAAYNLSTRPQEGMHQEMASAWEQTNYRDAEAQVRRIDQLNEAIAGIRININLHDRARRDQEALDAESEGIEQASAVDPLPTHSEDDTPTSATPRHWRYGAAESSMSGSIQYGMDTHDDDFHTKLHGFLSSNFAEPYAGHVASSILMRAYHRLDLEYRSMDDFTAARDILRCNKSFYRAPRYDSAILNDDSPDMTLVRIHGLFRCQLNCSTWEDVVYVSYFRPTTYKPATMWDGCIIRQEEVERVFILPRYLVRGAHMIPAFNAPASRPQHFYLDDCIDNDMFVRTTPQLQLLPP